MKKNTILHKIGQLIVPLKRAMSPLEADFHSAPGGLENSLKKVSLLHRPMKLTSPTHEVNFPGTSTYLSRITLLLLLLLTLGNNVAWGQTDYSGVYFIASDYQTANTTTRNYSTTLTDNFYLCPTENWISYSSTSPNWTTGDDKPFLTTYKARLHANDPAPDTYDLTQAKWTIEFYANVNGTDYYYFKHSSGQYMVLNNSISAVTGNNNKAMRLRVHLETLTSQQLEDEDTRNMALFSITQDSRSIVIKPKTPSSYQLTVNNGNSDYLRGDGIGKGYIQDGSIKYGTEGTIAIYNNANDDNKYFYLEDYITRPLITYNSDNLIEITDQTDNATNIYYTTDGTKPTTSSTPYNGPFDPAEGVTTIKAIAIVGGEATNVAVYTTPVLCGNTHSYLIQSQNNGWTIDENTTDFHFYMIPGDVDNNNVQKVNTTSLFRPSMEWHFESAGVEDGVQFYYIVNNSAKDNENNPYYLCWDGTNVCMLIYDSSDAYKFKFKIVESATAGSFNIIPYAQRNASGNTNRFVYKPNDGNNICNANAKDLSLSNTSNAHSQWKFVLPSTLDKNAPFTASDPSTSNYSYYKIANVGNSDYYIVPGATNAATSNSTDDAVVKTMNWFFEEALAATSSDWVTYYHIRNAVTGDYLYFNKDANNAGACLEMRNTIDPENADRYMFTWAKTADTNANYYIIPKNLKDVSQNQYSALRKYDNNPGILTQVTRGAGRFAWIFSPSSFTCTAPEVTFDGVNDKIILTSPNGADVYFNVNDENDISSSNVTKYTDPIANNSSTQIIRAVCARNGNLSDKSNVVTIIFNPTITLSTGASITYDGQEHQPTITSAKNGETTIAPSEYELGGYLNESGETVTGCKDAGDYTIVLSNHEGGDYFVYGSTTFTITPATLTVTAEAKEKDYLDPVPELTFIATGLQGTDEQADVLSGALACDVVSDVVGNTYPITQGSLSTISNYTISYTGATLTITAKSIGSGITPAAGITIDDITKSGSAFTTPAIKHNDTPLTLGTDYDDPITITGDATTKYYNVTFTGRGNYTGSVTVRYANVTFGTKDNTDYFATFVTNSSGDSDFAKPTDITPYIITGVDGDGTTLVAEELGYIPENVPVVLMASSSATNGFNVKVRNGGEDAITDDNKLVVATGTDDDRTFGAGEIYILYNGEFVLNASGTLAAGKVYLPKSAITGSAPAPARLLIRRRSGLSSIKDVDFSPLATPHSNWYTLDGRRLSGKPTRKGLYLQNGQKVVVK